MVSLCSQLKCDCRLGFVVRSLVRSSPERRAYRCNRCQKLKIILPDVLITSPVQNIFNPTNDTDRKRMGRTDERANPNPSQHDNQHTLFLASLRARLS